MTTELTAERIKKLLSDQSYRIELHELVHNETEELYKLVCDMKPHAEGDATKHVRDWMELVEEKTKTLRMLFAYGCYFGTEDHAYLWNRTLNRLGSIVHDNGLQAMVNLQLYPAMLVLYAGGVSAVASNNGVSLHALLSAKYKKKYGESDLLVCETHGWLLDGSVANQILELGRRHTPLSDHVHDILAADYPESLIVKDDFEDEYDRWEVLLGMVVAHRYKTRQSGPWAPVGRFGWRNKRSDNSGLEVTIRDIELKQAKWPPVAAGLFDGSVDDAKEAHEIVKNVAKSVGFF